MLGSAAVFVGSIFVLWLQKLMQYDIVTDYR